MMTSRYRLNVSQLVKWLYPGLRVKRWLLLAVGGALLFGVASSALATRPGLSVRVIGLIGSGLGLCALLMGVMRTVRSLLEAVFPVRPYNLADVVFRRRCLQNGLKVVAIGGGTGLSTLLSGLKAYTNQVTAIVTVADDGGSSGRLREEFRILPPGDIRNCLVALADAEPMMQQVFQYRFPDGSALQGHSFGNLFVAALTRVTGDFEHAIRAASRVLAIRGQVIPSTYDAIHLVADHADGSSTIGESRISQADRPIRRLRLRPSDPLPNPGALKAIREAELIVLGPGSLFTSLIPNLLVPGMLEALLDADAMKVYICNVMTQYRETAGFTASDHVRALIEHTHPRALQYCVVNTKIDPSASFAASASLPVEPDLTRIRELGYEVIATAVMNSENPLRHDPHALARLLIRLGSGRPSPQIVPQAPGWDAAAVMAQAAASEPRDDEGHLAEHHVHSPMLVGVNGHGHPFAKSH